MSVIVVAFVTKHEAWASVCMTVHRYLCVEGALPLVCIYSEDIAS